MERFVVRKTPSGYKFDLRAANGETVASSQVYATRAACLRGAEGLIRAALDARVWDRTGPDAPARNPRFEIYRDRAGAWRFRLRARNGAVVASSEPYAGRAGCENGIQSVRRLITEGFSPEVLGE